MDSVSKIGIVFLEKTPRVSKNYSLIWLLSTKKQILRIFSRRDCYVRCVVLGIRLCSKHNLHNNTRLIGNWKHQYINTFSSKTTSCTFPIRVTIDNCVHLERVLLSKNFCLESRNLRQGSVPSKNVVQVVFKIEF